MDVSDQSSVIRGFDRDWIRLPLGSKTNVQRPIVLGSQGVDSCFELGTRWRRRASSHTEFGPVDFDQAMSPRFGGHTDSYPFLSTVDEWRTEHKGISPPSPPFLQVLSMS